MSARKGSRQTSSLPFWTVPSRGYTPPPVKKGDTRPLPEKRKTVLDKIMKRLDEEKRAIRQEYSNGEFISSSIIVGKKFEEVADRKLELDGGGDEAHFDPELKLWWRKGGCFD